MAGDDAQQHLVGMTLAKLELKPGDILLVRAEAPLSDSQVQRMKDYLDNAGIDNEVFILWGEMDVRTLNEEQMAQRGWYRLDAISPCTGLP